MLEFYFLCVGVSWGWEDFLANGFGSPRFKIINGFSGSNFLSLILFNQRTLVFFLASLRKLDEQPEWLRGGKLRDYQLEGLNFLVNRYGISI